jgi:general secretion pathway protein N
MKPTHRAALWLSAACGALSGLLVAAPASWVAATLAAASAQRVQLAEASGSWHDGSALLVLRGGGQSEDAALAPGRLSWHVGLGELWRGRLQLQLEDAAISPAPLQFVIALSPSAWQLRQTASWTAQLPASLLQGLGTPWNTLALQARLDLSLHDLEIGAADGRATLRGDVRLDALDVTSRLSQVAPLGSYRLQLHGTGASATVRLSTLGGPLRLAGDGLWNGQQWHFDGRGSAAPERAAELASLLGLLGQPDGDHVRITL